MISNFGCLFKTIKVDLKANVLDSTAYKNLKKLTLFLLLSEIEINMLKYMTLNKGRTSDPFQKI